MRHLFRLIRTSPAHAPAPLSCPMASALRSGRTTPRGPAARLHIRAAGRDGHGISCQRLSDRRCGLTGVSLSASIGSMYRSSSRVRYKLPKRWRCSGSMTRVVGCIGRARGSVGSCYNTVPWRLSTWTSQCGSLCVETLSIAICLVNRSHLSPAGPDLPRIPARA